MLSNTLVSIIILSLSALALMLLLYLVFRLSRNTPHNPQLIQDITERENLRTQLQAQQQQLMESKQALEAERAKYLEAVQKLQRSEALLEAQARQAEEKIELLQQAQQTLKAEFQNLANAIMEEKSQKFTQQNKDNLENLMNPLREQLKEFRKKVEDTYDKESRDRLSLFEQIKQLHTLNTQLSEDAHNLTKALKGDSQVQGSWGELVLETILEQSGLEKGREYETQSSFTNSSGDGERQRYRPDVLIRLPENKSIIVDSKVSLTAYEQYCSSDDAAVQQKALNEHLDSVKSHVKKLSETGYEKIESVNTLDFVVMFMPIEAAFLLAMQADGNLHRSAMEKNIFIVSPSNLLVMLRTIHHIWRTEKQNQNARDIALQAGKMHDKFVGFVADMESIGQRIKQVEGAWNDGMNKLKDGRGNLIGQTEKLKRMGAKASKALPEHLVETDEDEQEEA